MRARRMRGTREGRIEQLHAMERSQARSAEYEVAPIAIASGAQPVARPLAPAGAGHVPRTSLHTEMVQIYKQSL